MYAESDYRIPPEASVLLTLYVCLAYTPALVCTYNLLSTESRFFVLQAKEQYFRTRKGSFHVTDQEFKHFS